VGLKSTNDNPLFLFSGKMNAQILKRVVVRSIEYLVAMFVHGVHLTFAGVFFDVGSSRAVPASFAVPNVGQW
jgi:hypothetical protein